MHRHLYIGVLSVLAAFAALPAFANPGDVTTITGHDWLRMVMGFLGGVSFLLYGLEKMSNAFSALAGEKMKEILSNLTRTRFSALMTGGIITAMIQSSAATTVMVVGFVSSGLMTLTRSLGVILGADIGTTVTVQLIAFHIGDYALFFVAGGFLLRLLCRGDRLIEIGEVVMGIGMIFFGIWLLGDSFTVVRESALLVDTLANMSTLWIGLLVGMVLTMAMQSSAATIAVVIALTMEGLIGMEAALIMTLGANVGTTMTAFVASIGKSRDARRAAAAHALFKVTGAIIVIPFLAQITEFASTSGYEGWTDARRIAMAHTGFNVMLAILFLPFLTQVANMLTRLIPDIPIDQLLPVQPKYIDKDLLSTPAWAMDAARKELGRMAWRGLSGAPLTRTSRYRTCSVNAARPKSSSTWNSPSSTGQFRRVCELPTWPPPLRASNSRNSRLAVPVNGSPAWRSWPW